MEIKHTLIFEPLSGGHREEFLSHLLDHAMKESNASRHFTFVVDAIPSGYDSTSIPNIAFEVLGEDERSKLSKAKRSGFGSFFFWSVLSTYLDRLSPDRLVILDLTYLELALCFRRLPCRTSAILFVQYPELKSVVPFRFRYRIKVAMKEFKTRLLLRNRRLDQIFLLNGAFACGYLNKRFKTSIFSSVPDPVPAVSGETGFDLRNEYGAESDRKVFLFFGSMSARKGVRVLLSAMERMPKASIEKSFFLFCGRPEPGFERQYLTMVKDIIAKRPDLKLHLDSQYVSSKRMRAMFEQADCILMPYTRPEYSSGILAHAAAARTPVIGTRNGLLGRQIREYELGECVEINPESLASALEHVVDADFAFNEEKRRAFVAYSDPKHFAEKVLGD